ncbi:MAG: L-dopachrome tautomerase-related protein [Cyanobacteria bacterium P01_E01_bin.6]
MIVRPVGTAIASSVLSLGLLGSIALAEPLRDIDSLDVVAEFSAENPPGNIAVMPDGRLIMSQHQFYGTDFKVMEVLSDGTVQPFPNAAWSSPPDENGIGLNNVLGIRADMNGVVWMLDNSGNTNFGRLIGWDTRTDSLHQVVYLASPVIPDNPFLNDFAIDLYHDAAYIADTAEGSNSALIVVDLTTGYARRVLDGHPSMQPEDIPIVIDGEAVMLGGVEARIGVNPITLAPDNDWVYYGAMNGRSLYRIRTTDLLDLSLSPDELASRVERFGDKPISDGITIDAGGNVYVTDITNNAIGITRPSGEYEVLYQDEMLSWTDGFGFGPDNQIYVTVNQLHRSPALSDGENLSTPPYFLVRFPALEAGVVGR